MAQHMAALHSTPAARGLSDDTWRTPHVSQRLFSRQPQQQQPEQPPGEMPGDGDQGGPGGVVAGSVRPGSPRRRQPSNGFLCPTASPLPRAGVQGSNSLLLGPASSRTGDGPSGSSNATTPPLAPLGVPQGGVGQASPALLLPGAERALRLRHSRTLSDPAPAPLMGGEPLFQPPSASGPNAGGTDETAPTFPPTTSMATPPSLRSSLEVPSASGSTLRLRHRGVVGGGAPGQPPLDRAALLQPQSSSGWQNTTPPQSAGLVAGSSGSRLPPSAGEEEEVGMGTEEEEEEEESGSEVSAEEGGATVAVVKESWLCPICLQTYDNPCTISLCGHNFCGSCLHSLLRSSASQPHNPRNDTARPPQTAHCPLCRIDFAPENVSCNRDLLLEMKGALIRCANRGCRLIYSPLLNKRHQDECDFSTAACPHQPHGCPFKAQRKDLEAHLRSCPFEQIKGFFPKLRASLDQTTAAMRGWENGFISQQQMLATHTALLRNFDRKSHHNPLDHFRLAAIVFWRPYCWPFEVERWSRSFSFSSAAMAFYLLPILLALLSIATRASYSPDRIEWTIFHPAQATPYPYPIIGFACMPETGCLFGISPKLTWVFLFLLIATSYVEAYDNTQWLGSFKLWSGPASSSTAPSAAGGSSSSSTGRWTPMTAGDRIISSNGTITTFGVGTTTTPGTTTTTTTTTTGDGTASSGGSRRETLYLQVTRYVLCTCVAWASYALGAAPAPGLRYLALSCMLPVPFAIQLVARLCCKFQRPVIRGLIFGLMLRCFKWQDVAGSWVLVFLLCRGLAGLCTTQGGIVNLILSKLPVKLESLGPWTLWGHFPGSRLLSPLFLALSALLLYRFDGVRMLQCLAVQLALEALSVAALYAVEKLLARAMRAPRPGTPVPPERRGDVLCVLYTRAVLLLAVFGAALTLLL